MQQLLNDFRTWLVGKLADHIWAGLTPFAIAAAIAGWSYAMHATPGVLLLTGALVGAATLPGINIVRAKLGPRARVTRWCLSCLGWHRWLSPCCASL